MSDGHHTMLPAPNLQQRRFSVFFRSKIVEPFLLDRPFEERAEVPAKIRQVVPYRLIARCDILGLQRLCLFMREEHSIFFPAIRVVNEGVAEVRTVIVIRQHYEVGQFSEEPHYGIYTMLITSRCNRDGVLMQPLLAGLQIALVNEEARNAFGLTLKDVLLHFPECVPGPGNV